jgi:hypothetical protein
MFVQVARRTGIGRFMMSAHATAACRWSSETSLRYGTRDDLAGISRLIHRANQAEGAPHIDESELELVAGRGQLLVLGLGESELAAAACISPGRGLVFLVIDPRVATPELEHRMIEVAGALCESEQRGRR